MPPRSESDQTPGSRRSVVAPGVAAGAQPASVDWELPREKQQGSSNPRVLTGGGNKREYKERQDKRKLALSEKGQEEKQDGGVQKWNR